MRRDLIRDLVGAESDRWTLTWFDTKQRVDYPVFSTCTQGKRSGEYG